jgi:hypothetical protein
VKGILHDLRRQVMNIRNLSRIAITALFLAAVVSVNADSDPPTEVIKTYFTGCDTLTEVGQSFHSCGGSSGSTGATTGDWRQVESELCEGPADTVITYWEKCGTIWVQRTTLGACQCSH